MPTYEYRCPQGHTFEKFQKISESPRVRCPTCGRRAVRQISAGAGLLFKGSGFYITDYGKDGKGPRKTEEAASRDAAPSGDAAKETSGEQPKPKAAGKPGKKKAAE